MKAATLSVLSVIVPFTLPFECGDPAPVLHLHLCANVSGATRGEISLRSGYTSGGNIRGAVLANQTSVNG